MNIIKGKSKLIISGIIFIVILIGCQKTQNNDVKLAYEKLSKREEYLLNVTGSKVMMYNIKNLPKDKNYEITLMYEVYKNTEKVKEKIITGILNDETCEKIDDETITISIQEDKIRCALGKDESYASSGCDIEEKLNNYSQSYLTKDVDLKPNTELYIYHAGTDTASLGRVGLGDPINADELNNALKDDDENIFIKLLYKKI